MSSITKMLFGHLFTIFFFSHIPEDMFLIAAETIAKHVTDEDIQKGSLYPPLELIRECSFDIAIGISKYAYAKGKKILACLMRRIFTVN